MATPDLILGTDERGPVSLPIDPFVSNRYHFGMLLGVADLEADQGYHRGKTWLHNAWLHGPGAVWGLGVEVTANGEVAVNPGLALDADGHELQVADRLCLDLGRWFAERRPDDLEVTENGGDVRFLVHVTLCARQCLDRPVPSISEPCSGSDLDTAYSRTVEQAVPDLAGGSAPADPVAPYPRLREFMGQLPVTDENVRAAVAAVEAAAPGERGAEGLTWFRRLAALDTVDLAPRAGVGARFPDEGEECLVLAEIGVHLRPDGPRWQVVQDGATPTTVDNTVRPAHVRTRTIQELIAPPDRGSGPGTDPEPPRAVAGSLEQSGSMLRVAFTRPLLAASVSAAAFTVTSLRNTGWSGFEVTAAQLDESGTSVTVRLASVPRARLVRLVAHGTGPAPLLGSEGRLLSGLDADGHDVLGGEDAALLLGTPEPGEGDSDPAATPSDPTTE